MDLPSPYESTAHYCASLGHKINHSFRRPSCLWSVARHPVFGRVPQVVAARDVEEGEELTCHYMIDMDEAGRNERLSWYVGQWEKESQREREAEKSNSSREVGDENDSWGEENDTAKSEEENYGGAFRSEDNPVATLGMEEKISLREDASNSHKTTRTM